MTAHYVGCLGLFAAKSLLYEMIGTLLVFQSSHRTLLTTK